MPTSGLVKGTGLGKRKIYVGSTTGPASYTTGGFTVTIDDLNNIEGAVVTTSGGYVASIAGISGNTITIAVYQEAGAAGALAEVTAGTDLSGVTFYIIAIGS